MIREIFSILSSPQLVLPVVLFGVGGLIISTAWNLYSEQANRNLPSNTVQKQSSGAPSISEIRSMLNDSSAADLDIIAEKNLFTPDRQAWQSPKKAEQENGTEDDQDRSSQRRRRIPHSDIRLYGTTITDSGKKALLFMDVFESKQKYHLAEEGQELRDAGERGEWLYYTVSSIKADAVKLEDPYGESFQIGLFDHKRKTTPTQKKRDATGIQIQIGGERDDKEKGSAQSEPLKQDASQAESSANDQEDQALEKGGKKSSESQDQFENSQATQQSLSTDESDGDTRQEEMERKVEEGTMKKIKTPFGIIYREAD